MEFLDDVITTNEIHDIFRLGNTIGSVEVLELKESIKDDNDKVLLQAKRPLKINLLETLDDKYKGKKFNFVIELNENLIGKVSGVLRKDIEKKLGMYDYSFAGYLFKKNNIDLGRVVKRALSKNFFASYLLSLLYAERKIWDHLMEVTLTSVGLLAAIADGEIEYQDYGIMFQAGMVHDYSIANLSNWQDQDSFDEQYAGHDRESGSKIASKNISPMIKEIIENHNHLRVRFIEENENKSSRWYNSKIDLMATILNVVEYYIWHKKQAHLDDDEATNATSSVLYQLGLLTEKGNFPYGLMKFFRVFYSKYTEIFDYGQKIGEIENSCVHKLYALAYPKPKTTQVLCRDNLKDCPKRIHSQRINVVKNQSAENNRYGTELKKGWYDKCSLTLDLPNPPEGL